MQYLRIHLDPLLGPPSPEQDGAKFLRYVDKYLAYRNILNDDFFYFGYSGTVLICPYDFYD